MVIADSGGVKEESTFLGVPYHTVRENTERPITVSLGANPVVGRDLAKLGAAAEEILQRKSSSTSAPKPVLLWDGHAAERIARIIMQRPAD